MAAKMTQDESAVLALASGLSWRAAAKQSGMSARTIARRMTLPEFRKQVIERRAALLDEAAGRLTALMRDATRTLKTLLSSPSDAVKLGACRAILDAAISVKTVCEFEQRMSELEGRAK